MLSLAAGCGSTAPAPAAPNAPMRMDDRVLGMTGAAAMAGIADTDESKFGPLEVGADHAAWFRAARAPFLSPTHGNRFVEVFVNDLGRAAYYTDADFPVGTVIVKTSRENDAGRPGDASGPIFVMEKRALGHAPDHDDWSYAIHWASPTERQLAQLGGPIYWRGASPKVGYCSKCHDNYDRSIGGVPKEVRSIP